MTDTETRSASAAPTPEPTRRRHWWVLVAVAVAVVVVIVVVVLATGGQNSPATTTDGHPVVVTNPDPSSGPYHSGQTISLSVGPNKYFAPYARIIVIECADPGGQVANLPINENSCDGNTVQAGSILVNKNGSFSESRYTVDSLPNPILGESQYDEPVCNLTHQCVLYVGQDQSHFTAPKVFSAPFTVKPPKSGSHP